MFIAIKIVSRVVRPPRLFLRIPKDPKISAKAYFEFQRYFTFFRALQTEQQQQQPIEQKQTGMANVLDS